MIHGIAQKNITCSVTHDNMVYLEYTPNRIYLASYYYDVEMYLICLPLI